MDNRRSIERRGFWALALLWLPAGLAAIAVARFWPGVRAGSAAGFPTLLMLVGSLAPVAPCGLPLALACRRLWRLGYPRTAWTAGVVLGVVTVAASLVAGLLGPIAIAIYAVILSLPVWVAGWWLNRRSHRLESPPLRVRPERTRPPGPFRAGR